MNLVTISLIVLSSILVLILIGVVIWRILESKKDKKRKVKKFKQFTSDSTIKELKIIDASIDGKVIVNLLIKNNFSSQNRISLIPGILISDNKIFFISNIIDYKKNTSKIVIKDQVLLYNDKNKFEIFEATNLQWMKDVRKWANHFDKKVEVVFLVKDKEKQIINETDFRCLSIYELIEEMKMKNSEKINKDQIAKTLLSKNKFKVNNGN